MLEEFNSLPEDRAARALLACCASPEWVRRVLAHRPFRDLRALQTAGADALHALDWTQVRVAMDAHPRIGERASGGDQEARWSRGEQSAAATEDAEVQRQLVAGNQAYEARFGHVFLICATGKTSGEVLTALRHRLGNEPHAERDVARAELGGIVALRLAKLVG
ncbi:2-oxo-4-hydroxy-4-carboxy-5-ureidoimidazoline decarboxylase [Crossiella equi]|uniref:2-oxo-4-hydroxy-4-carboxy-5-ureidoimidazoline decarboxylase n=1 Tax=Crossiella equi TaxID=130796 RepID=A0ABS5ALR6_9PSEU|nr:2-oxo-4-hydroxy-4-carboxy-5-ureidoimidazoline decarboxylase [Crossiella equi]MBP2477381.1 2-oxo-4-hydroxy-4-carboxy-5-ureidoimidazoline decarboxylase [Crossiella equi]